jgi:hypothetical protein
MGDIIMEYEKRLIEIYTKHVEISAEILQSIKNLITDLKMKDENFKVILNKFEKIISDIEQLRIYIEKNLQVHDDLVATRHQKTKEQVTEMKDNYRQFYITHEQTIDKLKSRINYIYIGFFGILLTILGFMVKLHSK